jgi:hypothetical protein
MVERGEFELPVPICERSDDSTKFFVSTGLPNLCKAQRRGADPRLPCSRDDQKPEGRSMFISRSNVRHDFTANSGGSLWIGGQGWQRSEPRLRAKFRDIRDERAMRFFNLWDVESRAS